MAFQREKLKFPCTQERSNAHNSAQERPAGATFACEGCHTHPSRTPPNQALGKVNLRQLFSEAAAKRHRRVSDVPDRDAQRVRSKLASCSA